MKDKAEKTSGLYKAKRFNLYAKVANQQIVFGVRDISAEGISLAVEGRLDVGMQFTVYVFKGEVPVASALRLQVIQYTKGYAKCRYVDLTPGQAKEVQLVVTSKYLQGAPIKRRRSYTMF